jgi:hypothetical protein|eukprot:SAG25_NODE_356_length_9202_cov_4.367791_9_plen_49_part_00
MCMSHTHAPALHRPLQKDTREAKCAHGVGVYGGGVFTGRLAAQIRMGQ